MKHHDIQLTGSISITGSLTVPVGTTDERPLNPKSGSLRMNTTTGVLEVYTAESGSEWVTVGEQTGPVLNTDIEYLLVAGGGGGGARAGGGGGAGGYLSSSLASVTSGSSFSVTVGAGGTAGTGGANGQNGGDGADSTIAGATISTITSIGGGGGGGADGTGATPSGGSGGGASYTDSLTGGTGTAGQGFDGGDSTGDSGTYPYKAGGGGGASEVGADGNVTAGTGGDGGDGKQSNITGTLTYYAGGGGGGTHDPAVSSGAGGQGGGGAAGASGGRNVGTGGTANTGGGGGGGSTNSSGDSNSNGSTGGSGVAIFAYESGSFNCAGGIVGDAGTGRKYHQFNVSSTFKVGSTSDFQIITENLVLNLDAGDFASRGASTWTDTINGQNATISSGTPTLGSNFYYSLDGSGDIFSFTPSNVNSSLNGDHTWEFWVYPTANSEEDIMGSWGEPSDTAPGDFLYMIYNGKFRPHYITTTTVESMDTTTSISTNTWYHIVAVIDFTNSIMKAFINGTQDATTNTLSGAGSTSSDAVYIGNRNTGAGSSDYTGRIAQIRYYSKALSAAEVLQNYNATKTNFV